MQQGESRRYGRFIAFSRLTSSTRFRKHSRHTLAEDKQTQDFKYSKYKMRLLYLDQLLQPVFRCRYMTPISKSKRDLANKSRDSGAISHINQKSTIRQPLTRPARPRASGSGRIDKIFDNPARPFQPVSRFPADLRRALSQIKSTPAHPAPAKRSGHAQAEQPADARTWGVRWGFQSIRAHGVRCIVACGLAWFGPAESRAETPDAVPRLAT